MSDFNKHLIRTTMCRAVCKVLRKEINEIIVFMLNKVIICIIWEETDM